MLPARNRKDLEEMPERARKQLNFVWLDDVDDALAAALEAPKVAGGRRRAAARARERRQEEPTDGTLTGRKTSRGGAERAVAA